MRKRLFLPIDALKCILRFPATENLWSMLGGFEGHRIQRIIRVQSGSLWRWKMEPPYRSPQVRFLEIWEGFIQFEARFFFFKSMFFLPGSPEIQLLLWWLQRQERTLVTHYKKHVKHVKGQHKNSWLYDLHIKGQTYLSKSILDK